MSRDKERYLNEAKTSLLSATMILDVPAVKNLSPGELRAAVTQLTQATQDLNRLIGALDAESDLPKRATPRNQPLPEKS